MPSITDPDNRSSGPVESLEAQHNAALDTLLAVQHRCQELEHSLEVSRIDIAALRKLTDVKPRGEKGFGSTDEKILEVQSRCQELEAALREIASGIYRNASAMWLRLIAEKALGGAK